MKKNEFLKAIETLKLYRRSELVNEEGQKLINELYVDPLPNEHVLHTILQPNTTFLIGRKGTGKSTIFQRAHEALDLNKKITWAYIDIKTLYESSASQLLESVSQDYEGALSNDSIRRLLVFKSFVLELVKEIRKQISIRIGSNIWSKIKSSFSSSTVELFEKLDEFIQELQKDTFINVTGIYQITKQDDQIEKEGDKISAEASAKLSSNPEVQAKIIAELIRNLERKYQQNYSEIYIKVFDIKGLIEKLREVLSILKLKHIYIFIDDFSELPKNEMEEVVDSILVPFNNWSDEFIKLKVAVYPGRLYVGDIDRSKIDEVYLDIYRAYGRNDVSGMEEKAIDFTKRLILRRLKYFCSESLDEYFDYDDEEFWRVLFNSCLGNPRILGYVLYFCYETNIIYDRKISIRTIQDASRRYYQEKIEQYFKLNKFLHETFEERSSIYSLKELFEQIVIRAKTLRNYRESKVMKEISGRPPTSHFYVLTEYDGVLSTLELNFFITKYYEMKDRDGREVSVYALNLGLCQQQTISFGRPREKREHRLYFVERIFDYSPIITSYIKMNQEIVCDSCYERHDHEMLPAIQQFGMLCPKCKKGKCKVINLSKKYERLINEVSEENLLPKAEIGILKTLHDERNEMFAKEIAAELDCSYQLVGKRGKILADRDLVIRDENEQGRRVFQITSAAEKTYFSENEMDNMDFGED